jgi:hypothetical protein
MGRANGKPERRMGRIGVKFSVFPPRRVFDSFQWKRGTRGKGKE